MSLGQSFKMNIEKKILESFCKGERHIKYTRAESKE